MTNIYTRSGTAEMIGGPWMDGEAPKAIPSADCITIHERNINTVWKFTGKLLDAAETIGGLYVGHHNKVALLSGTHIEIKEAPSDLFIGNGEPDEDGEYDDFVFNAVAYPNVVAA
jgi:hypothetical protein